MLHKTIRVLAIDPGYDRAGIAVLEKNDRGEQLLYSGCLRTEKAEGLEMRLLEIGTKVDALISEYSPSHIALETLFFNNNQKTAFSVAQARGIIVYLAGTHRCVVCEYSPQAVKIAVTGYGKSAKPDVARMLPRLISGVPETALDDEYDAIAIGLTCLASVKEVST